MAKHILVVDDEPGICALVERCLSAGGYQVSSARTGAEMRHVLAEAAVDLVVLDLMLPGEGGLDLLRELRGRTALPVIILTALGEPVDRVVGLELGADDYVAKPFEPREILARVRNLFRRLEPKSAEPGGNGGAVRFAGWRLDLGSRRLTAADGAEVRLTTAEFGLLEALVRHSGRVLTRDQLLDLARGRSGTPYDRSIDVHIGHLRRKIEDDPRDPRIIKTIYGAGYVFTAATERG